MKRAWILFLSVCILFSWMMGSVCAEETGGSYEFSLTSNSQGELTVSPGDIITVRLTLTRTEGENVMYGMQDEIQYDSDFFELVEDSDVVFQGIETTDLLLRGNLRTHYWNFVSLDGGTVWPDTVTIGTFQLKVKGDAGVTTIQNRNYQVSREDGTQSYAVVAKDLKVIVSTDCLIRFESNGGTAVEDQTVAYGEKITRPQDPQREGYRLQGWYRNIDRTELWDFDADTVTGNMTLYAGWEVWEPVSDDTTPEGGLGWGLAGLAGLLIVVAVLILRKFLGQKGKENWK